MECKDCIYIDSLEKEINNIKENMERCCNKYDKSLDDYRDRLTVVEKENAVSGEQIKSIFKILNEIKDSIQVIAINLEEKPSVDDYTRKQIDNMEEDLKVMKEEEGKTYKHIKVAIITAILTGFCTIAVSKIIELI